MRRAAPGEPVTDLTPTDDQARAIKAAVAWYKDPNADQVFLLDGCAGTGKTTTMQFILAELSLRSVAAAAYTGKAARVMRQKGIPQAQTLHSLLYTLVKVEDRNRMEWRLNLQSAAAHADLVVLDEVSMINFDQASDLTSLARRVLVLGDTQGQLPPIEGTGAFEQRTPDYRLTELTRHAADSDIVRLALMALRGERLETQETDQVWVLPWEPSYVDLVASMTPSPDRVAVCGKNSTRRIITRKARARLGYRIDTPPRGSEPLICCQNNRDFGLWNGMTGTVRDCRSHADRHYRIDVTLEDEISMNDLKVDITRFDQTYDEDIRLSRPRKEVAEFDWAYALTCHKVQGSEYADVVVFDESTTFREMSRRWLYTALTRAREKLTVFVPAST